MAINERLIDTEVAEAGNGGAGTGNQEEGLILHLDANDVDSYDGDGSIWYDIKDHEYKPATNVSEHFNTVTYTGNNSSKSITGVGFQPDLVWVKNRTNANSHNLIDSVRGATKVIYSNGVNDEDTRSNSLTSFDSDGFSLGNYVGVNGNYNYVAWCFKAGGAPTATNTGGQTPTSGSKMVDGTAVTDNYPTADIYPTKQSVNTKLGFSVTEYTGAGSNKSLPHGLDVPPEMYIIKRTSSDQNWWVYTTEGGDFQYLSLNETSAAIDADQYYTRPTGSIIKQGNLGTNIMYSFASKRGVSKVGSYTGTGTSGNKIYTGFEPAFVMMKRTSSAGAGWYIVDNKRDTNTNKNKYLSADSSAEEATSGSSITFNRDGFTFSGSSYNTSGQTHIYLAFAKDTNETELYDTDPSSLEVHLDAASFPQKGESGYSNTPTTWTALTGNNGTITNGALFDSELGNYLDFDGSNDYVSVPSVAFTYQSGFSYEVWFRAHTNTQGYICRPTGSSGLPALSWRDYSGWGLSAFHYTGTGSGLTYLDSNLDTNKWYHAVYTADSSGGKFYIDGEEVATSSTSVRSGGASGTFYIGNYNSSAGNNFDGDIGQFRLYSTALTQDQVRQNFNFTKNDYPNGVDVAKYGATFDASTHTNPDVDAFSFDGTNDYFDNNTFNTMLGGSSYTLSAWIYVQGSLSGGGAYVIMSTIQSGSGLQLDIIKTNGNLRLYHSGGTAVNQQSSSSISTNTWYHIICVRDRNLGKVNFFIDGIAAGSSSITGANGSSNGTGFEIGRYNNGYYFNGDIAQVKVFNKAMTTAEAEALFNQNATTFGKTEV